MQIIGLTLVLGVLLLFVLIIAGVIDWQRMQREKRAQISRSLGFEPVEPDDELTHKIAQLYSAVRLKRTDADTGRFKLSNVSVKRMFDARMYLFDLRDTSGEDGGSSEIQSVAVVSSDLFLPTFVIIPKSDTQGVISRWGNHLLSILVARFGTQVEFPHIPEFERKYLVSSPDPQGTRRFLDSGRLASLAQTGLIGVLAGGDVFILSKVGVSSGQDGAAQVAERVNLARTVYEAFRAR